MDLLAGMRTTLRARTRRSSPSLNPLFKENQLRSLSSSRTSLKKILKAIPNKMRRRDLLRRGENARLGYARLCPAMPGYARLFSAVLGYARLCPAMPGCARLCSAVLGCARLCSTVLGFCFGVGRSDVSICSDGGICFDVGICPKVKFNFSRFP